MTGMFLATTVTEGGSMCAGDKYELFMVEDVTERNEAAMQGRMPEQSEARLAFKLVTGEFARPPAAGLGKTAGAAFLFLATFASCAQLGLLANVAKLPKVPPPPPPSLPHLTSRTGKIVF